MNRKQKSCLWLAIAIGVGMGIFPPWTLYSTITYDEFEEHIQRLKEEGYKVEHTFKRFEFPLSAEILTEYHFILNRPRLEDQLGTEFRYKFDFWLLFGQWLFLALVTYILIGRFETRKK